MSAAGPLAVLGATGMLGQALCREAHRRGFPTARLARTGAEHLVDATDSVTLCAVLDTVRPNVIINAAAQTGLEACERDPGAAYVLNAGVAATLADYCSRNSIKLVHVSTDHYFSGDADGLHDENARVRLLNEYARTKYAAEAFTATCPRSLVVRTNVVGFRGWEARPTFLEWAIAALQNQEPVTLFEDFYTSSIDVEHFASILFDLLDCDARELLNVAAREPASKAEFVLKLARRLKLNTAHCRLGSVRSLAGVRRAESLGLDVRRAEDILGYRLPDTQAVIQELASTHEEQQQHAIR